jgi:Rieske Fe-S protein
MPGRKTGVFVATFVAAAALGGGTAMAAPYENSAQVAVSSNSPAAGETIAVAVSGFQPGEVVDGLMDSTLVFNVRTDSVGDGSLLFVVPASAACGAHTLIGHGQNSGAEAHASITVVGDCGSGTS